ncbi:MAG TPA: helix-turn-helix domain-containing protein [Propionibacteriaceae bacterium]|nr:helix-turn-helix domain-containing protein [Propionibacteriaceae bacterium]
MPRTAQILSKRRLGTISEAAILARCSVRTIRRRIADGTLHGYRFGGMIRVDLDELDAAMRPIPTAARAS